VPKVLSGLPNGIPAAILVVQHMASEFVPSFTGRLRWACPLPVSVAQRGDVISSGQVLVAPGSKHTTIITKGDAKKIGFSKKQSPVPSVPSIDYTMESAADAYGDGVMGVLLTGVGSDGARGMKAIKDAGGSTIAQDQATSAVFGMPRAAIELGCVDKVVPLSKIAQTIVTML
jgi:two-component system chemotaxis response regulator CheB